MINRREFLKISLMISGILAGGAALIREFQSADNEVPRPLYKILDGTYKIKAGHPRIFLSPDRLTPIRIRCADKKGAQSMYYSQLKNYADKFVLGKSKAFVDDCLVFAFLYAIGEVLGYSYTIRSIEEYGKIGIDILTKLSPRSSLGGFSEDTPIIIACYDWFFGGMGPKQRSMVFENCTSVADAMSKKVPILGQYRGTAEMYGYFGLAFNGDGRHIYPDDPISAAGVDKKAKAYSDFFVSWHKNEQIAILETTCKGGAYSAGTMYGETPFPQSLWPYDAWETASEDNLYENSTIFAGYPLFLLYQMLPFRTHVRQSCANGSIDQYGGIVRFGDYRYIGYTAAANRHVEINIAQAQGVASRRGHSDLSSVFNWLIQYQDDFAVSPFGGPLPTNKWIPVSSSLVWDIIFRDGLKEAKPPSEAGLSLAYHFGSTESGSPLKPDFPHGRPEGGGVVVMRSSWDDPDGTLLWFKASSHAVIHSHRDQGSFQIYKKGWLAIDSGQYEETAHRGNYHSRTVAHNSLLIYQPGEGLNKEKVNPVWYGYANDGGQRWVNPPKAVVDLSNPEFFLGGITKFETVPDIYDYAHADITRSYNSTHIATEGHDAKVSLVTRSILFLRPKEFLVIFDKVNSVKAEYPKRWLLHSIYRPELDGREIFEGVVPHSHQIPGKPRGVRLCGDKKGGISESKDSSIITIKGWNFGPADGRLICRTLLPLEHVTRVIGGSDLSGTYKTFLVQPYSSRRSSEEGATIFVQSVNGFAVSDFVYLGPTMNPYSAGSHGQPNWPVDDIFYQGWGKIKSTDKQANSITMVPYRYGIPNLPSGTPVIRSDHANASSFEFMDAEYNQWHMYGEGVANAGPFNDQHGSWRVEVEPIVKQKEDVFLHVMIPCDAQTLSESQKVMKENIKMTQGNKTVELEVKGTKRIYKILFDIDSSGAKIIVTESGKTILDNQLTGEAIKARAKRDN